MLSSLNLEVFRATGGESTFQNLCRLLSDLEFSLAASHHLMSACSCMISFSC